MPAMRSLWPGINGNATGSTVMVSNMRKRAIQASRFMLQMMQVPLYAKEIAEPKEIAARHDNNCGNQDSETSPILDLESGEEGLAIRIAVEVYKFTFSHQGNKRKSLKYERITLIYDLQFFHVKDATQLYGVSSVFTTWSISIKFLAGKIRLLLKHAF